jgi:hypothetical protein
MAFKLPYTIGCDHVFTDGDHCNHELTVYARGREEANALVKSHGWFAEEFVMLEFLDGVSVLEKDGRMAAATKKQVLGYQHFCPIHVGDFKIKKD